MYAKLSTITAISFAQADKVRGCPRCREYFTKAFKMPRMWWEEWCRRSNGYFGCEETVNSKKEFEALSKYKPSPRANDIANLS